MAKLFLPTGVSTVDLSIAHGCISGRRLEPHGTEPLLRAPADAVVEVGQPGEALGIAKIA
jgi:hypothetical protein